MTDQNQEVCKGPTGDVGEAHPLIQQLQMLRQINLANYGGVHVLLGDVIHVVAAHLDHMKLESNQKVLKALADAQSDILVNKWDGSVTESDVTSAISRVGYKYLQDR